MHMKKRKILLSIAIPRVPASSKRRRKTFTCLVHASSGKRHQDNLPLNDDVNCLANYTGPNLSANLSVNSFRIPLYSVSHLPSELICAPGRGWEAHCG